MADDIFREVTEEEKPKILDALKNDWPKHFIMYQHITIMAEHRKKGLPFGHTLYIHGSYETGVYLNKIHYELPGISKEAYYIYTPSLDLTQMSQCLQQTQVIPWQAGGLMFQMEDSRFRKVITEAMTSKELSYELSANTLFWYPPEKELSVELLPDDVYLDFLDESFAAEMDRNWPHRSPGSEFIIKQYLQTSFGLGIFKKSDKKLVSSVICMHAGGIFILHTDPECRGKGYARLIIQQITQEIRKRGWIPFCTVIIGNRPSETAFTKCGFEPFCPADYIFPKKI